MDSRQSPNESASPHELSRTHADKMRKKPHVPTLLATAVELTLKPVIHFRMAALGDSGFALFDSLPDAATKISREKALPRVKRNEDSETNLEQKVLSNEENEPNDTGNYDGVDGGFARHGT